MKRTLILLLLACLAGCGPRYSSQEQQLLDANSIDDIARDALRPYAKNLRQLKKPGAGGKVEDTPGLMIRIAPDTASDTLVKLRQAMVDSTSQVYVYGHFYGFADDLLVVVPTRDEQSYLDAAATQGTNGQPSNAQVKGYYQDLCQQFQLELVGAGGDWLRAKVLGPDPDWFALAKAAYTINPDILNPQVNSIDALAANIEHNGAIYLFWR